jgi:hypothetical protein
MAIPLKCIGAWFAGINLLGCGGGIADTEPPPPPPPPSDIVSYAAIAGDWQGTVTELRTPNKYTIQVRLPQQGAKGSRVGEIRYLVTEAGFGSDCVGTLATVDRSGEVYRFGENIASGPCVQGGTVVLTYAQAEATLKYEWFNSGGVQCCEAVMRRP